ncbi:hypothetical protein N9Z85_00420 [Akkermansiaceae bacterium]|jgi:hypothetical protein|nr:hypothetical protein [Akkermansiaceae bacterium]MDB4518126.1 hypothetical protein [Akkermansiaceae bacterium]
MAFAPATKYILGIEGSGAHGAAFIAFKGTLTTSERATNEPTADRIENLATAAPTRRPTSTWPHIAGTSAPPLTRSLNKWNHPL